MTTIVRHGSLSVIVSCGLPRLEYVMTIAFPCENCGHRFEVDASLAGKKCQVQEMWAYLRDPRAETARKLGA